MIAVGAFGHYTPEVQASLPLFDTETHDPAIAAAEAAGLVDVRLSTLEEVERVERETTPERGPRQPRYVLSARVPGA